MKNYSKTIEELEKKIQELAISGIAIQPLNASVDELKRHVDNVEKIEENIEAIREEVIEKIKEELEFNKKAGNFSIYGFWVGSIALLMSIFSIGSDLLTHSDSDIINSLKPNMTSNTTNTEYTSEPMTFDQRLERIEYQVGELVYQSIGFNRFRHLDSSEYLIANSFDGRIRITLIEDSVLGKFEMAVLEVYEEEYHNTKDLRPSATFAFFLNGRKVGKKGILEIFDIKGMDYVVMNSRGGVQVFEGDTIRLFYDEFVVEKIYMTDTETRRVGDDENAVLIKKTTEFDYDALLQRHNESKKK